RRTVGWLDDVATGTGAERRDQLLGDRDGLLGLDRHTRLQYFRCRYPHDHGRRCCQSCARSARRRTQKTMGFAFSFVDGLSTRDTAERSPEALLHDGVAIGDTIASAFSARVRHGGWPFMQYRRTFACAALISALVSLPLAAQWPAAEKLDLDAFYR